jgi:hypothetical protein
MTPLKQQQKATGGQRLGCARIPSLSDGTETIIFNIGIKVTQLLFLLKFS